MKLFIFILGAVAFVFCASFARGAVEMLRAPVDRKTFLRALEQVESDAKDGAVGRDGERGRYQITRAVWEQHTVRPFAFAHKKVFAHAVAERHFDWIFNQLQCADWPTDVESIATAWNAGLSATINNRITSATRDYAQRVANLYNELRKEAAKS